MVFLKKLASSLAFLVLIGLVGILLAERNHQRYRLQVQSGRNAAGGGFGLPLSLESEPSATPAQPIPPMLVIQRGRQLPFGFEPLQGMSGFPVDVYEAIPIPQGTSPSSIPSDVFENRAALDQALFVLLERWVTKGLKSSEPEQKRWVELYIERATRLPSISESQRDALRELRADAAFHEGERLMEQIQDLHKQALEAFGRASASDSQYKERARMRLDELLGAKDSPSEVAPTEPRADKARPQQRPDAAAGSGSAPTVREASPVESQGPTP